MSIESDIQLALAPLASGRCYPLIAPDASPRPYIIYQVISNVPQNGLDGDVGLSNRRVQVDVWADSYGAAKTLAASVTAAMKTAPCVNVKLSDNDLYEPEVKIYRVTMDFSVWGAS